MRHSPLPCLSAAPPASPVTWFHVEYDPSRPLPPLAAPSQPGAALASALPGVTPMVLEVAPQEDDIDISNLIGNLITTTFQVRAVKAVTCSVLGLTPIHSASGLSLLRHVEAGRCVDTI